MIQLVICTQLIFLTHMCAIGTGTHWTYTGRNSSPTHWAQMKDNTCGGSRQSPIPLNYVIAEHFPGTENVFIYEKAAFNSTDTFNLGNNGHTLMITLPRCNWYLSLNGYEDYLYCVQQIHFHWGRDNLLGSEHSINGKFYPLEMHIVSFDEHQYGNISMAAENPNALAVLGILFEIDEHLNETQSPLFKMGNFLSNCSEYAAYKKEIQIPALKIKDILTSGAGERIQFFRYQGSLTTPPCTENVWWTVLAKPVPVTPKQLLAFRTLQFAPEESIQHMGNNFRPLQPVNPPAPLVPRIVYRSWNSGQFLKFSLYNTIYLSALTGFLVLFFSH